MTMPAAARKNDFEICPAVDELTPGAPGGVCPKTPPTIMVAHVGGPIISGSGDVNINGLPAARCGDRSLCVFVNRVDLIVTGAAEVRINGRLAAMVGSKIWHAGQLASGSSNVNYGAAMAGATFGNSTAATDACLKAAATRKRYQDAKKVEDAYQQQSGRPYDPEKLTQRQSKYTNCGQESVRQLCLQRCTQDGPGSKACDACNYDEDQWYRRYLEDKEVRDLYNTAKEDGIQGVRERNDARWAEIKSHRTVWHGN
ncbi:MAG: hypothetical protein EXR75_10545, partial [Myxococcales bacterium]|nr:hypothetical protein [Myxococcales bacterium]